MIAEQTPAARARRQATAVAAVAAIVPTILAAQGMTYLAIDLLGFPIPAAIALASFLELALVSSALLARAAALAGRPGGADATAVWVVSATSGLLAAMHELVVTTGGSSTWHIDPGSVLAAAVRAVAPLVAAWLWERVLQAARAEQADRTLAEVRRDRRLLAVARAALAVRRLEGAGRATSRRGRRARRSLDRAHLRALRVAPPAATLADVLAAVGQIDHLPDATRVAPSPTRPDTSDCDATGLPELAAVVATPSVAAATSAPIWATAQASVRDDAIDTLLEQPSRAAHAVSGGVGDVDARSSVPMLELVVELLRANPSASGAWLAEELTRRGRPVSQRSGQRWRARAAQVLGQSDVRQTTSTTGQVRHLEPQPV